MKKLTKAEKLIVKSIVKARVVWEYSNCAKKSKYYNSESRGYWAKKASEASLFVDELTSIVLELGIQDVCRDVINFLRLGQKTDESNEDYWGRIYDRTKSGTFNADLNKILAKLTGTEA